MKHHFYPGAIIAIDCGIFDHWAIVSNQLIDGVPMLISLSARTGTVCEETWQVCVQGRRVRRADTRCQLPAATILTNARRMLGVLKWDFFNMNCEHFARWANGMKVESKQLQRAGWVSSAAIAVLYAASHLRK